MGHIIPKLNLNRNPELVDNYGLVCAKNIRLLPDGTIGPDTAEVNLNIQTLLNDLLETSDVLYKIVGVIPYNTCFYLFVVYDNNSYIIKYDEKTNKVEKCNCNWNSHYTDENPTKINGLCNVTLRNEIILNIAEYYENENETVDKIPFKSINLAYSDESDDESIYTFAPNIPVTNITFEDYYYAQIKTGMYVFYVRYEIKDGVYTNWFLASLPMYSAYFKTYNTVQGYVRGIDVNLDADKGFVLKIDHLFDVGNIKKFQLGFKASLVDGGIVARSWKTFDISTKHIYFDYSLEDIEEIDISDLEKPVNQLYNVKNITNFKNKLYFSNYTEEDFNPNLIIPDNYVTIALKTKKFETRGLVINETIYNDVTFEVDSQNVATDKVISIKDHNDILHRENIIDWFKESVSTIDEVIPYGYNTFYTTVDFCFKFNTAEIDAKTKDGQSTRKTNIYIVISLDDYTETDTICIKQGESWNFTPTERIPNWKFTLDYDVGFISVDGYRITNVIFEQINPLDDTKYKIQRYSPALTLVGKIVQGLINNNIQTLIPYQGYNFYIHFVKRNGVVTNGYPIGSVYVDKISVPNLDAVNCIYPTFTFNDDLPTGYVGCFISMSHVKNLIVSLYTLHKNSQDSINNEDTSAFANIINYKEAFDLDTLNIVESFGTTIDKDGNDKGLGTYYAGSDPTDSKTFGSSGKFYSPEATAAYIKYPYNVENDENIIYKATNYITYNSGYTYDNVTDVYLQGFFCIVTKPARAEYVQYIAGSTFYYKDYENDNYDIYIETDLPISHKWNDIGVSHPKVEVDLYTYFGIFSNYNNNFVTIQETPQTKIKSYKDTQNQSRTRNILLIDSGNLYQIYSLNAAFKTKFTQVYKKENKYLIDFSNTIRSTGILDEQVNTRYYLDDTEYYNIPTTKGIIINMKAIGNSIIVHTEDSMFVFSGANTLSAQGGEQIQLKEGNVFESGIKEVFGSEYGFGGIQKHHHQISSENGYLFYDSDSKNMYVYQDNQQLLPISNSIKKLLKDVIDVELASDYYNDRFFIKLIYPSSNNLSNNVVLSFNVKTKSFLSLHDINFDYAFNSKTLCYFVKDNNIYRKEVVYSSENTLVQPLYDNVDIFPIYIKHTNDNKTLAKPYIDIICNNDYDNVKVLDYVSWICKKVNNPYRGIQTNEFVETDDNSQLTEMNVAEEDEIDYPAQGILIYSNLTAKGTTYFKFNTVAELDAIFKENRRLYAEQGLYDATGGTYGSLKPRDMPYFQLGHWNYNGFRNDLDNTDITGSDSYSDNKSLLYGNYFVVRLIFDVGVNFKLKDLMFAINNSYETRR